MADLYKTLIGLCDSRGITGYRMCKDLGIQPSIMTDLKMGRRSSMKMETANKIASYFGVSVGYLLGTEQMHEDGSFSGGSGYGGGTGSGAGFGDGSGHDGSLPINKKRPVYDDEAWAMMEEMYKRPELKALFKTTKHVKPEDIKAVDDLLKRMARESGYDT